MPRYLLACLLCCQLCKSQPVATTPNVYAGGGSVIITIVDKDSIVLMADSRQSFDNKRPTEIVNKINTYQNIFYAQAGTSVMMRGGEKILDLNDTVGSIIKNTRFKNIPKVYKKWLGGTIKTFVDKYHVHLHTFTNHDDKDSFVCKVSIVNIQDFLSKNPAYFTSAAGLLYKCIYLIKLTAAALPGEVGCPINIVVIKPTGSKRLLAIEDCGL